MPEMVVGTSGGNKVVLDPWIGTDAGNRQVQEMYVGTPGGNRLVFTRNQPVALTATAVSTSRIDLSWTNVGAGVTYTVKRGASVIYTGTGLAKQDTGLAASTTYNYSITAKIGNVTVSTATASAKTAAATTQTKTVTLNPSSSGSYLGNGNLRNTTSRYSGNYTPGSNGTQKSSFHFAIPAEVRNCVRIDKVEFSVRNSHTYGNSVTQYLAVTHTSAAGATWPGSTGVFGGRSTKTGDWYGSNGTEWVDITADKEPTFNATVAENFRVKNAYGICLVSKDGTIGYYSYWQSSARLRLTYTIRT